MIRDHAVGAESLDRPRATRGAVDPVDGAAWSKQVDHVLGGRRDESRQAMLDQLGNAAHPERDHRTAR